MEDIWRFETHCHLSRNAVKVSPSIAALTVNRRTAIGFIYKTHWSERKLIERVKKISNTPP